MKFVSLFKKEIRELMTLQTIVGVLVSLFVFLLIGQFVGNVGKEMSKQMGSVVVADRDDSNYSQMGIKALENAGFEVTKIPGGSEIEMLSAAETHGHSSVLVIPEGFGEGLGQNKTCLLYTSRRAGRKPETRPIRMAKAIAARASHHGMTESLAPAAIIPDSAPFPAKKFNKKEMP